MSEIEITVRGSFTAYAPAERATVRLAVQHDGGNPAKVLDATTRTSGSVRSAIERLHDPDAGPVTWWANQEMFTWAHRPWNNEGKQLPLVHSARVEFEVKFSDFSAMSAFLGSVGAEAGVTVRGIEWALTAKRREAMVNEVRVAAVRDAVAKAEAYASAFGLTEIRATAIADVGMLNTGAPAAPSPSPMFARRAAADVGGADPQFAPGDIAVNTEVDARFVVT